MNKEKFLKIMTYMGIAYNKEFTKEQLEVWYSFFKEYTDEELNNAVKKIINTEKYLPSIAQVKEEIAKMKVVGIPEAEEEWQEVLKAVSRYGSYRQDEALASLKPYTAKIVGYIGYQRICMAESDEQIWNKKEFISEYDALKDRIVVDLQIGAENIKGSYLLENKEVDIIPQ